MKILTATLLGLAIVSGLMLQACSEGGTTTVPCRTACGAHSYCQGGVCVCEANFRDCNLDKVSDGCECPGTTCNGTVCGTPGSVCSPKTTHSCYNASQYCSPNNTCLPCQNSWNCNGTDDCECGPTGCSGSTCAAQQNCTYALDNSCGTNMKYCAASNTCIACIGNARDCNGKGSDLCECPNGCNGTACGTTVSCDAATAHSCSVNTKYCAANSQCVDCSPSTRRDCNGLSNDGCECENGCKGEQCDQSTTTSCDPNTKNACSSNKKVCSATTRTCQDCGTAFECDGYSSTFCECPSGCDGEKCVVGDDCDYSDTPSGCGMEQYCSGSPAHCIPCPKGLVNCDQTKDCECVGGCNGASCRTTPCGQSKTCNHDQYCLMPQDDFADLSECISVALGDACYVDHSCACLDKVHTPDGLCAAEGYAGWKCQDSPYTENSVWCIP